MKELAHMSRASGRTTTILMNMIEEMDMHEQTAYLVVGKFCHGMSMKDQIRKLNGNAGRVQIIPLESLHILNGVNAFDVYIEHTAYEFATARQLQHLFAMEDAKDNMTQVGPII